MKIFHKVVILIIFILIVLAANIFNYFKIQKDNEKYVEICKEKNESFSDSIESAKDLNNEFTGVINDPKSCYCRMYTRILPRLLVYKVKHNKKELEFIRPAHNEYVVPTIALEKADAFIGYGIGDDINFEYVVSGLYKKNIYAYDCGVRSINKKNEYLFFGSECIGLDDYILKEMGQISSGKIHTFGEKLKELKLEDKKVFLKMDIAGADLDVMPDVIKYHKNLTGMSFVIRFNNSDNIIKYEKLLRDIEKNFILVARNELPGERHCDCNYKNKTLATTISLTYINNEYADEKYLPLKQSYNQKNNYKQLYFPYNYMPKFEINWILILSEKIKLLLEKNT